LRTIKGDRDTDIALANQRAEQVLVNITSSLDRRGTAAIGGLSYRISRSKYYADMFRDAVTTLRIGNIETWWSYRQFAERGMEPALREIASVGERMSQLRTRVQAVKQDILQSSIASQTEATRDNTFKLEVIQEELKRYADATVKLDTTRKRLMVAYFFTMLVYGVLLVFGILFK
jgi:uncharacterized membrane-anchored protein